MDEILKVILDQTAGLAISVLLITRVETKLDGLTNAVTSLSEILKAKQK